MAKSIYDSVEKGVDLINNLLHFSKRGGEFEVIDLDLYDVIMKTYNVINRVVDKKIEIKLKVEQKLYVRGNQSLLNQVFMNLVTNARDAMPEGGLLSIVAWKSNTNVHVKVIDTGHGMNKETVEKIFDPFFTLKDVGRGTGLGLSSTHGIVEQHGGSISVTSQPEKGTTFTLKFPLTKPKKLRQQETHGDTIYGEGQKILIVDDELPALDALTGLTNALKYKAIPVSKPELALDNYMKWSPDVVLMDRNMPKMDGITCIKQIKESNPEAKIIIVSGYEETGANGIDESVKSLIQGYITKPCRLEELSKALSKVLEK